MDRVQREELAGGQENLTACGIIGICGTKTMLYLEPGNVIAECSEPDGHGGDHFDSAFGKGWHEAH